MGFGPGVGLPIALRKVQQGNGKVYGIDISEQVVSNQLNNFMREGTLFQSEGRDTIQDLHDMYNVY